MVEQEVTVCLHELVSKVIDDSTHDYPGVRVRKRQRGDARVFDSDVIDCMNAELSAEQAKTAALETKVAALETKVAALEGHVSGLHSLIVRFYSTVSFPNGLLQRILRMVEDQVEDLNHDLEVAMF